MAKYEVYLTSYRTGKRFAQSAMGAETIKSARRKAYTLVSHEGMFNKDGKFYFFDNEKGTFPVKSDGTLGPKVGRVKYI